VVFITAQEDAEAKKAFCIIEALEVQTTHPMANYLRPVNIQVGVRPSKDSSTIKTFFSQNPCLK
jgi:hypothetical protein